MIWVHNIESNEPSFFHYNAAWWFCQALSLSLSPLPSLLPAQFIFISHCTHHHNYIVRLPSCVPIQLYYNYFSKLSKQYPPAASCHNQNQNHFIPAPSYYLIITSQNFLNDTHYQWNRPHFMRQRQIRLFQTKNKRTKSRLFQTKTDLSKATSYHNRTRHPTPYI